MKPTASYDLTATQRAALGSLAASSEHVLTAEARRLDAVLRCRGVDLSWELIARELGISRQAAWERYSPLSRVG